MTTIIRTETRKRGVFGHLFKWLFILFNILMIVWFFAALGGAGEVVSNATSEAEKAGAAVGTAIGASFIVFFWVAGAIILGLFTLLTRGKKIIVEEQPS